MWILGILWSLLVFFAGLVVQTILGLPIGTYFVQNFVSTPAVGAVLYVVPLEQCGTYVVRVFVPQGERIDVLWLQIQVPGEIQGYTANATSREVHASDIGLNVPDWVDPIGIGSGEHGCKFLKEYELPPNVRASRPLTNVFLLEGNNVVTSIEADIITSRVSNENAIFAKGYYEYRRYGISVQKPLQIDKRSVPENLKF